MSDSLVVGIAIQDIFDAGYTSINVVRSQYGQQARDFHSRNNGKRYAGTSLFQTFGRSQLHRLVLTDMDTGSVATEHQHACAQDANHSGYPDACQGKTDMALAQQIPRTDAYHEDRSGHPTAGDGVQELHHSYRIKYQCPEVDHFVTNRVGIELHAYRMLHPGIGHQDPHRRNAGTDTCHPSCQQVGTLAHLVPPKEHDCEEGRLHEKGQNPLDGKRRTENVAHKPRIIAPVGSELEFQNDTSGDTYRKINGEELHPELGRTLPELVFLDDIEGFHGSHNHRQPQRKRDENPMVTSGKSKLRSRPVD